MKSVWIVSIDKILRFMSCAFVLYFISCQSEQKPWTFVSMPDFLNVDTDYPQSGWEDALDFILESVKKENPDFLLVAGDLLMGHWYTPEEIDKYADRYYPAWMKRLKEKDLDYYATIGDHEIGDNPWPDWKAKLVPLYKEKFREYLKMPSNGPEYMKGTAFWWKHKNVLFIAVDVFEKGKSDQGEIRAGVTSRQLAWFKRMLEENKKVNHVVVMGHTPVLGPVRKWSSSGLMLTGGRQSSFWQTMKEHNVDLYLCGEVHAITCTERDGIQQIAHGGLIGYNPRTNYLVARVFPKRIELELKEIDMDPSGKHLWQPGKNRPLEKVTIPSEIRERGFVTVGRMTIDKSENEKVFHERQGYFLLKNETSTEFACPVFRDPIPGVHTCKALPRITINE